MYEYARIHNTEERDRILLREEIKMKRRKKISHSVLLSAVLVFLLICGLSGCGQTSGEGQSLSSAGPENAGALQQENPGSSAEESESAAGGAAVGEENGSAASSGTAASGHTSDRSQTTVLEITVEGETERVPATLYTGSGYSIYIPDEGWKVGTGENSVSWTSTDNDRVSFSVTSVTGKTSGEALTGFVSGSGFIFEDLQGGGYGDPLFGRNENDDILAVMSAESVESTEKESTVFLISWTYPAEAEEGFGARLAQITDTFERSR